MKCRHLGSACLALIVAVLGASSITLNSAEPQPARREFHPVDTGLLLGSPDPLPPLEIVKAFPKLQFKRPVALANAGDGSNRLFVCDQPGIIYVFPDREDVAEAEIFLDITDRANYEHFEEGLLGLAFHPDYETNGEFFVYYSTKPRSSVISRFKVSSNPDRADRTSEEKLIEIPQPFGNHNGGSLEFGPDGMLYIGFGDGGKRDDPHGNGQNLQTLLGSILRIDINRREGGKNYAIPADNPFVDSTVEGTRGEIYAYGIRNPWRLTFDRLTGTGWIADVGQDKWEEINILKKGANYGWKIREGLHPWKSEAKKGAHEFVDPIFEYRRELGKSITGGYVYRGKSLPELYGAYFYGDFVTFNLWALRFDGKKTTSNHLIARSSLPITAFGEAESGELYIAAFEVPDSEEKVELGQLFRLDQGGIYRMRRRAGSKVDTASFPRRLSQTGLFVDMKTMKPARGLIPFDVNVPLWSDGASKHRYMALPAAGKVEFSEKGAWKFPVGTVLVKTFELAGAQGTERLETRLLVHSDRGWDGYTYLWNEDLSDAQLLDTALTRSYEVKGGQQQDWYYPSRSDCNACHTEAAGIVLGPNTRQLNRMAADEAVNQISRLDELGIFTNKLTSPPSQLESYPDWEDDKPSAAMARAYLDTNCAMCHTPGGTGLSLADLRFHTPLDKANLVDRAPGQGRLGGPKSALVKPGAPQDSELLIRIMRRGAGQMPTLASFHVDTKAVHVIRKWIESLGDR